MQSRAPSIDPARRLLTHLKVLMSAALVALAVGGDVLRVPPAELLDGLLDHLVIPGLPHRLGAVVGMSTGAVPVTLRARASRPTVSVTSRHHASIPCVNRSIHVIRTWDERLDMYLDRLRVQGQHNPCHLSDPLQPTNHTQTIPLRNSVSKPS
jgi:hypothetical protein